MRSLANNYRPEEDEIIRESGNERSTVRIRVQDKSKQQKRGDRCTDHTHKEIERQPEGTPRPFEAFADKPQKPECQHDPEAERLRNKDVGDQSPDLAVTNARRIEIEGGS